METPVAGWDVSTHSWHLWAWVSQTSILLTFQMKHGQIGSLEAIFAPGSDLASSSLIFILCCSLSVLLDEAQAFENKVDSSYPQNMTFENKNRLLSCSCLHGENCKVVKSFRIKWFFSCVNSLITVKLWRTSALAGRQLHCEWARALWVFLLIHAWNLKIDTWKTINNRWIFILFFCNSLLVMWGSRLSPGKLLTQVGELNCHKYETRVWHCRVASWFLTPGKTPNLCEGEEGQKPWVTVQ